MIAGWDETWIETDDLRIVCCKSHLNIRDERKNHA